MSEDTSRQPALWRELESSEHADCRVFSVTRRRFEHPERKTADDFFVIEPADWAVAMARTSDGKWVLGRQFRFGLKDLTWEFPSGCIDPGEDPAEAARRELAEESGFEAPGEAIPLGVIHPNPAIMDNRCAYFLFLDVEPSGNVDWDTHEEIQVRTVDDATLTEWATQGQITHALMHAGLYLYGVWAKKNLEAGS